MEALNINAELSVHKPSIVAEWLAGSTEKYILLDIDCDKLIDIGMAQTTFFILNLINSNRGTRVWCVRKLVRANML